MNKSICLFIVYITTTACIWGCWAQPPSHEIISVEARDLFLRKCNREGVVEIRNAKELQIVWKAKIDDFNELFSSFYLTRDGEKLIHVKGNHMVNSLEDYCIDIYGREGKFNSYKVSEFLDELPTPKGIRTSISPSYLWLREVKNVLDDRIYISSYGVDSALFYIDKHEISVTKK